MIATRQHLPLPRAACPPAAAVLLAISLLTLIPQAVSAGEWSHDFEATMARAKREGRPVVLHFSAVWCGPCRMMEAQTLHRPEVAQMLDVSLGVLIDSDDRGDLKHRYGIRSIPADIVVDPSGRAIQRRTGFASAAKYVGELRTAIARATPPKRPAAQPSQPIRRERPLLAGSNQETPDTKTTKPSGPSVRLPMVRGYSVVALHERREWTKGDPQFSAAHRGQLYWFTSDAERQQFLARPRRYTPRLLGCDAVIFAHEDRATMGSVEFAAFYGDDLFLFVSDNQRTEFKRDPESYLQTRVVTLDEIDSVIR